MICHPHEDEQISSSFHLMLCILILPLDLMDTMTKIITPTSERSHEEEETKEDATASNAEDYGHLIHHEAEGIW